MRSTLWTAAMLLPIALAGCGGGSSTSSGSGQRSPCDFPDRWGVTQNGGCNSVEAERLWTANHRAYHDAVGWSVDPRQWHAVHGQLRARFPNPVLDHSCTSNCVGGAH